MSEIVAVCGGPTRIAFVDESERSMTPAEWRWKRRVSKSSHYELKKRGLAPEETIVPGTKIARISPDADRRWEARMARLAETEAARLEAVRRRELASVAGRIAAESPRHVSKRQKQQPPRRRGMRR